MNRSTLSRLRSYIRKVEARNELAENGYTSRYYALNNGGRPYPKLPSQNYLEESWLPNTIKTHGSNPVLVEEAKMLVSQVAKERRK